MDRRILDLLEKTTRVKVDGLWLTPKSIALAIDANNKYVNTRLGELLDRGYVEKGNGSYRITQRGLNHIQSGRG